MNKKALAADARLAQLCAQLQIGSELSAVPMHQIDRYLAQLSALELYHPSIVLGPVVISRSYGVQGPSDSGELIQAAISSELGTVAVFWDSEDYAIYRDEHQFEEEATKRMRPLCDCAAAVRAAVWPHMNPLLEQLLSQCRLKQTLPGVTAKA